MQRDVFFISPLTLTLLPPFSPRSPPLTLPLSLFTQISPSLSLIPTHSAFLPPCPSSLAQLFSHTRQGGAAARRDASLYAPLTLTLPHSAGRGCSSKRRWTVDAPLSLFFTLTHPHSLSLCREGPQPEEMRHFRPSLLLTILHSCPSLSLTPSHSPSLCREGLQPEEMHWTVDVDISARLTITRLPGGTFAYTFQVESLCYFRSFFRNHSLTPSGMRKTNELMGRDGMGWGARDRR